MSNQLPNAQLPQRGKRHPLLFQQRFNEQIFWPIILILSLSVGLLVWDPAKLEPYRATLRMVVAGTGLILVLTFIFRLRAYAQCTGNGLNLQLVFVQMVIPYREIRSTRPTELYRLFPPEQQRWPQRRFLRSLFGRTVVVIEMEQLPRSKIWLRIWMNKYMLCPDRVGLVLAVRDWMAFRAELDEFSARSRHR